MPLDKPGLEQGLKAVFEDVSDASTIESKAKSTSDTIRTYCVTGLPQTQDEGKFPALVAVATVIAPGQSGSGEGKGGVDSTSDQGVDKSQLKVDLQNIFDDLSDSATAASKAADLAEAINNYFSKAKIKTNLTLVVGPAPGLGSPAAALGAYLGNGEGKIEDGNGMSFDFKGLADAIASISSDVSDGVTTSAQAEKLADAIDIFIKTGKVETVDVGSFSGGTSTVVPPFFSGSISQVPANGLSAVGKLS